RWTGRPRRSSSRCARRTAAPPACSPRPARVTPRPPTRSSATSPSSRGRSWSASGSSTTAPGRAPRASPSRGRRLRRPVRAALGPPRLRQGRRPPHGARRGGRPALDLHARDLGIGHHPHRLPGARGRRGGRDHRPAPAVGPRPARARLRGGPAARRGASARRRGARARHRPHGHRRPRPRGRGCGCGCEEPARAAACAPGGSPRRAGAGSTTSTGCASPAHGPAGEELSVPAAGVPWFLTLFGRDSLLTSFFVLPYRPATAAATLRALAAQGTAYDAERGEEPGRIVHEVRHGELAHFRPVPYGRYHGSVDATPLFLALLGAYTETTGDPGPARELERHARAAVDWMHGDGGLDAHGYLVYRPDPDGLVNQNWKDSAGAICFRDGTQAEGPVAVVEAQGYAYDALLRTARLAREHWDDPAYATRLEETATALRARFARDFWLADEDFPALALDGKGRQVDGLASDAGHLLWSGILDEDRARRVGSRLLEPDFFTGWAVRTLAAGQPAHHPLSYHRGSAWPHDNAVIALGLARYGTGEAVRTLTAALAETAAHHGGRLPEVLAGYDRSLHTRPVPYPHACSPQAWAAATPLALLTSLRTVGEGTAGTRD
ncbi:LOW QUALITY PROTEIN: amylo-alpha-1,6-glucosidase, partial [Streptomyces sp. SPB78]